MKATLAVNACGADLPPIRIDRQLVSMPTGPPSEFEHQVIAAVGTQGFGGQGGDALAAGDAAQAVLLPDDT